MTNDNKIWHKRSYDIFGNKKQWTRCPVMKFKYLSYWTSQNIKTKLLSQIKFKYLHNYDKNHLKCFSFSFRFLIKYFTSLKTVSRPSPVTAQHSMILYSTFLRFNCLSIVELDEESGRSCLLARMRTGTLLVLETILMMVSTSILASSILSWSSESITNMIRSVLRQ